MTFIVNLILAVFLALGVMLAWASAVLGLCILAALGALKL